MESECMVGDVVCWCREKNARKWSNTTTNETGNDDTGKQRWSADGARLLNLLQVRHNTCVRYTAYVIITIIIIIIIIIKVCVLLTAFIHSFTHSNSWYNFISLYSGRLFRWQCINHAILQCSQFISCEFTSSGCATYQCKLIIKIILSVLIRYDFSTCLRCLGYLSLCSWYDMRLSLQFRHCFIGLITLNRCDI